MVTARRRIAIVNGRQLAPAVWYGDVGHVPSSTNHIALYDGVN